jgi:hypothetical protein
MIALPSTPAQAEVQSYRQSLDAAFAAMTEGAARHDSLTPGLS